MNNNYNSNIIKKRKLKYKNLPCKRSISGQSVVLTQKPLLEQLSGHSGGIKGVETGQEYKIVS